MVDKPLRVCPLLPLPDAAAEFAVVPDSAGWRTMGISPLKSVGFAGSRGSIMTVAWLRRVLALRALSSRGAGVP